MKDYAPHPLPNWAKLKSSGHWIGATTAEFVIVEFGDFQCPACGGFHRQVFAPLRDRHPGNVALVFRHWPLPYHPMAMPAAVASECAGQQGRFEQMHGALYDLQDSLGILSLQDIARRAGVSDATQFRRCMDDSNTKLAVEEDARIAEGLGGFGTPTLIVNGMLLEGVPDSAGLEALYQQQTNTSP